MNNLLDFWTDETSEPIIETKPELPLEFQNVNNLELLIWVVKIK